MKSNALAAAFLLVAISPMAALAGPIFNVNRTIGAGSVIGTIETDGFIGILSTANVIDWNLTINDGASSFNLNLGNSGLQVHGDLLSATETQILFNFTGVGGFALFQNPTVGSGINLWCIEGISSGCTYVGNSAESVNLLSSTYQSTIHQGVVAIAGPAPSATEVPEPASLALIGMGLLGLATARRRRK